MREYVFSTCGIRDHFLVWNIYLRKEEISDETDDSDFDYSTDLEIGNSTSSEQNTSSESNSTTIINDQPENISATSENLK